MKINVYESSPALGQAAAVLTAEKLNAAIAAQGNARLLVSTGASQFDTIKALVEQKVDWSKVEMFHLDEYLDMPDTHPASFRKYLRERMTSKIALGKVHFVTPEIGVEACLKALEIEIRKAPIDVALIGIGENSHIAFNDPPADFDSKEAYFIVKLDERCRKQQLGEGWFPTLDDVPKEALSMTPYQIMLSKCIISCVPYAVKADAIKATLEAPATTNMIPATLLKEHADWTLMIDKDSASKTDAKFLP